MSKSMNKVILCGTLGKDPELKYTPQGTAVATFSMATNSGVKNKQGGYDEVTEWHNVKAWAKSAELIAQYTRKGSKLLVEGRLETQSWDDKTTGQKKYKTEVIVSEFVLVGEKLRGAEQGDATTGSNSGTFTPTNSPEPAFTEAQAGFESF